MEHSHRSALVSCCRCRTWGEEVWTRALSIALATEDHTGNASNWIPEEQLRSDLPQLLQPRAKGSEYAELKASYLCKHLLVSSGFKCCLELVIIIHQCPEASMSPWWSCSRVHYHLYSVAVLLWGMLSSTRLIFPLGLPHTRPSKPEPPKHTGWKERKILSCLTFCERHWLISEVNHHEWSHLGVRLATPLRGWITRWSASLAEETAGDFLSALSPFMTCLTVPVPFTETSCFAKRNR